MLKQPIAKPDQVILLGLSLYMATAANVLKMTTPKLTPGISTDLSIPGVLYAPIKNNSDPKFTTPRRSPASTSFLDGGSLFLFESAMTDPTTKAVVKGTDVKAIACAVVGICMGLLNQAKTRSMAPLPTKMMMGNRNAHLE